MTIYKLLKKDHDKHRELLEQIVETSGDTRIRSELWQRFYYDVKGHAAAEEESFYAELIATSEGQSEARHSVAEHKELDDLMEELNETDLSSPEWLKKAKTLQHEYLHHIEEEEEDIFPVAKKVFSESKAKEIGQRFSERKTPEVRQADQKEEEKLEV